MLDSLRQRLIGNWTDWPGCSNDAGFALGPTGAVYFDTIGPGTWSLDPQGRVVLNLVEDNGGEPTPASRRVIRTLTLVRLTDDELVATFENGSTFTGHRCPLSNPG